MEKNIVREIDIQELEELAVVGGSDTVAPRAITTPLCAVVATITVVTMISGMIGTVKEIC